MMDAHYSPPRPDSALSGGSDFETAPNTPALEHIEAYPPPNHYAMQPPSRNSLGVDSHRTSFPTTTSNVSPSNSSPLLAGATGAAGYTGSRNVERFSNEKSQKGFNRKRKRFTIGAIVVALVVFLVVFLPIYFLVINKSTSVKAAGKSGSGSGSSSGSGSPSQASGAITGGNGSTIVLANGTEMTYINPYGGTWYYDEKDIFNNNAKPNSWTPALNTSWTFGSDRIYGVNLGGWFVLEPFITPAFFQAYPGAVDEWTLSTMMAADTKYPNGSGLRTQLEHHYDTFVTEEDIAQIAGAGLNWIRVPIPYWAIETWEGEPFLEGVAWQYILRLFGWARKYGIRINLDLHTVPGSQNGYNHSGKLGSVNFLNGVMGIANAQRTLNYIRIITEFISQPEWQPVIPIFGIVNEALVETIGFDQIQAFYKEAHDMIRGITGYGEGNGAYIAIHDGFQGLAYWAGVLAGSDRIIMDSHPYFAFDGSSNDEPVAVPGGGVWPAQACNAWGPAENTSQVEFGVTISGEFSLGFNPCGLFLEGPQQTTVDYAPGCDLFQDASQWNETMKAGLMDFALASMDALQDWFFWTWKIAPAQSGIVGSPTWSYQLGLEVGVIPPDPRSALNTCASLDASGPQFDGTYQPWMTGGVGAGTLIIPAASLAAISAWPPPQISGVPDAQVPFLPVYTTTGTVATLPAPTNGVFGGVSVSGGRTWTFPAQETGTAHAGNGWFDSKDTALAPTAIAGCTYPDPWDGVDAAVPTAACTGPGSPPYTPSAAVALAPTATTTTVVAPVRRRR